MHLQMGQLKIANLALSITRLPFGGAFEDTVGAFDTQNFIFTLSR